MLARSLAALLLFIWIVLLFDQSIIASCCCGCSDCEQYSFILFFCRCVVLLHALLLRILAARCTELDAGVTSTTTLSQLKVELYKTKMKNRSNRKIQRFLFCCSCRESGERELDFYFALALFLSSSLSVSIAALRQPMGMFMYGWCSHVEHADYYAHSLYRLSNSNGNWMQFLFVVPWEIECMSAGIGVGMCVCVHRRRMSVCWWICAESLMCWCMRKCLHAIKNAEATMFASPSRGFRTMAERWALTRLCMCSFFPLLLLLHSRTHHSSCISLIESSSSLSVVRLNARENS